MTAQRVNSKTLVEYSAEKIDKVSNEFREKNDCIATTTNVVAVGGQIMFTQTIFYRP
jgi:hypothetical protein